MDNSVQDKWEKRATVRSRPRIIFNPEASGYFFPLSHQPLSIHPKVAALGKEALDFLLIQSLYKYSNDIATIETRVVNQTILSVITSTLPMTFSHSQKIDLYTIMIDEAYHAYVAFDAMLQIEAHTGVAPLALPRTIEIEHALAWVHEHLDSEYHGIFNLLAVCLAENTLTKEIVSMTDKSETHPFFQKLIKDHLSDESRHSGVFFKILGYVWENIDVHAKQAIAAVLVPFLKRYLGLTVQIEFDTRVLVELGLSKSEAAAVLNETYDGFKLTQHHPMLKNIILILTKSGVMDELTCPHFKQENWI